VNFAYLIEPPFNHHAPDGTLCGSDIGLARHVFQVLGRADVNFVETAFSQLLTGLADRRWQMTTGLFITDDRRRNAIFRRPIWALPDGGLKMAGYGFSAAEIDAIV
jgi:polar amino acid transport system substrate-binding protein